MSLVNVDWEKIQGLVKSSGFTQREIGKLCGKSESFVGNGVMNNYRVKKEDLDKLCIILRTKPEELIVKEEEPVTPPKKGDGDIEKRLEAIENKLDQCLIFLSQLNKVKGDLDLTEAAVKFRSKPSAEKAKLILLNLVNQGYGKCLLSEYRKVILANDVPSSCVEQAIKDCGYEKATTGLGNNTTTWIIAKHWDKSEGYTK